ncbi:MAG: helix-turn-helix domain-containing protein [Planctomycetota bacterium]
MIQTQQHATPAWQAHGGRDVIEPATAYDGFVALVRGLVDLGYDRRRVARFARVRWRALCARSEDAHEPMPLEAQRALGEDACAHAQWSAGRSGTQRRTRAGGSPRTHDHATILRLLDEGLRPVDVAARLGCSEQTVCRVRMARLAQGGER